MNAPALGIGSGLHAFVGGIGFILSTPSVWGYALVPLAMVLALMTGLSVLGIWATFRATDALFGMSSGWWAGVGSWVLTIVAGFVALTLALVLSVCLAQPFSTFALEAIVHAQERALLGYSPPAPGLLVSILRSLVVATFTIMISVPLFVGLFVVNLSIPPAMVVTVPLKFLLVAWLLAWNFLDYPLGIHGLGVAARIRWFRRHFDAVTAFGAAWAMLMVVPGVVLLLLPMGVAGATRLVVMANQGAMREV